MEETKGERADKATRKMVGEVKGICMVVQDGLRFSQIERGFFSVKVEIVRIDKTRDRDECKAEGCRRYFTLL